jgi:hypothetical protein
LDQQKQRSKESSMTRLTASTLLAAGLVVATFGAAAPASAGTCPNELLNCDWLRIKDKLNTRPVTPEGSFTKPSRPLGTIGTRFEVAKKPAAAEGPFVMPERGKMELLP